MTHTLMLALRNLQRNRRRSLTTLLAMIVGVSAILLFGGFSRDITLGLQTDFVQRSGHLQIQRQGYFLYGTGDPAAYGIRDYPALIERLRRDPQLAPLLQVVTPTLQFGGIAGNFAAGVSRTVMGFGAIPDDQYRMQQWNAYGFPLRPRAFALRGSADDAAIVGLGVARVLHLCAPLRVPDCHDAPPGPAEPAADGPATSAPPDVLALAQAEAGTRPAADGATHVEVLTASAGGAPNVGRFSVVKADQQGVKELDDVYLAVRLPQAQRLVYGGAAPRATAIEIQLARTADLPAARARIEQLLHGGFDGQSLDVVDFATLNPFYDQTNRMFSVIFGFVFVLISAIVLFVISNTMSTAIIERTVEIGTLRAMGMRRGGIQRLFVCEGALLGVAGASLGVLVALAIASIVNHSGLAWTPPARIDAVALTVRVWGEWRTIAVTFVGLACVAGLSAWLPSRHAARLSIVDALRHV
ncbi:MULTISPECIES: ABC transporter permease [unclassified Burkholderia]|uniref:ABC transporter permease n=1 Tax=unclassified Burkholderia TaxID=2613784 RepID=UPI000755250C|nr:MULTISPECIES: FtsX-like permease family protein [unclassified Burkholderia]KUY89629.1 ABC transporter permease [Burkholderia sp. RF7-non_BP1]KUZ06278.1 ABC transporter permease [Burkholderia sp. RF7-non_BP4]